MEENNKKIIAKEVNPNNVDFGFYFDDDALKEGLFIPETRLCSGLNSCECRKIQDNIDEIVDIMQDVTNKIKYRSYENYKDLMNSYNIKYNSKKANQLKRWAIKWDKKNNFSENIECMKEFLNITTDGDWETASFRGYSQGDYCEILYDKNLYSKEWANEIGKMYLGCGTEFCIDDCYGYFVIDEIRWKESELKEYLAKMYGCKPEDMEVHLYNGEHTVTDYKLLA